MHWFDPSRVDFMPITESTSTKVTYFDPTLVIDETVSGVVSVACKRIFLSEVESGGVVDREQGTQWLTYESKRLVWKTEQLTLTPTPPPWLITMPADVWETWQTFVLNLKGI